MKKDQGIYDKVQNKKKGSKKGNTFERSNNINVHLYIHIYKKRTKGWFGDSLVVASDFISDVKPHLFVKTLTSADTKHKA